MRVLAVAGAIIFFAALAESERVVVEPPQFRTSSEIVRFFALIDNNPLKDSKLDVFLAKAELPIVLEIAMGCR